MNRFEYWILESAIEIRWPLSDLARDDHCLAMNRKTDHGMNFDQLFAVLRTLFDSGYLAGWKVPARNMEDRYEEELPNIEVFVPNDNELLDALRGVRRIDFELTEKGGAVWESVSRPNWDHFVADVDMGKLISRCRDTLEEYTAMMRDWPSAKNIYYHIEKIQPCQVTYWKSFPEGYLLTFNPPESEITLTPDLRENQAYHAWFKRVRSGWYTNPFE